MADLGSTRVYGDLDVTGSLSVDGLELAQVTTSTDGLMLATDKVKLNGIQTNAAAINDSAVSATTTWSSQRIVSELGGIGTILDQINGV